MSDVDDFYISEFGYIHLGPSVDDMASVHASVILHHILGLFERQTRVTVEKASLISSLRCCSVTLICIELVLYCLTFLSSGF